MNTEQNIITLQNSGIKCTKEFIHMCETAFGFNPHFFSVGDKIELTKSGLFYTIEFKENSIVIKEVI